MGQTHWRREAVFRLPARRQKCAEDAAVASGDAQPWRKGIKVFPDNEPLPGKTLIPFRHGWELRSFRTTNRCRALATENAGRLSKTGRRFPGRAWERPKRRWVRHCPNCKSLAVSTVSILRNWWNSSKRRVSCAAKFRY